MTCRGSRFADGAVRNPDGQVFMKNRETDEWLKQNQKATREFIRKWGHFVKHDKHLKPIVPPKFDIGIVMSLNNIELLRTLEPWCSNIYCDTKLGKHYIATDQDTTSFDLSEKIKPYGNEKQNGVLIKIDERFTNNDFGYIQQISEILADSGEVGEFELGSLLVSVIDLTTTEKDLIVCKR